MYRWLQAAREAAFLCRDLGQEAQANELHTCERVETALRAFTAANAAADAILGAANKGLAQHPYNPPLERLRDKADELLTLSHDAIEAIEAEMLATEADDAERDASDRTLALVMGEGDDPEDDLEF